MVHALLLWFDRLRSFHRHTLTIAVFRESEPDCASSVLERCWSDWWLNSSVLSGSVPRKRGFAHQWNHRKEPLKRSARDTEKPAGAGADTDLWLVAPF